MKEALLAWKVPHFFLILELQPTKTSEDPFLLPQFLRIDRFTQTPKYYGCDTLRTAMLCNTARVPHSKPDLFASLYIDLFFNDVLSLVRASCTVPFRLRTTNCFWFCWTVWYELLDITFPKVPEIIKERCAPFYNQSIYRLLKGVDPTIMQFWPH